MRGKKSRAAGAQRVRFFALAVAFFFASQLAGAQDEFFIKKIEERGVAVDSTDGALVIIRGVEYYARKDIILHSGDAIKVLRPNVSLTVQGKCKGHEISCNDCPAFFRLGATQTDSASAEQTAGRVYYRVFPCVLHRFRSLLGPKERIVPLEVEGTIFSVEVTGDNIEIVVSEGRVRLGEPGSALFREINNGNFINLAPGAEPREGPVQSETIIRRLNDEVSEITVSQVFDDEPSEREALADRLLPRAPFKGPRAGGVRFRRTRVFLPPDQTLEEREAIIARFRAEGEPVVDVSDPRQCWAYADHVWQEYHDAEQAAKFYRRALDGSDRSVTSVLHYNLAVVAAASGHTAEAEEHLQQSLAADSNYVSSLLFLSQLRVERGDFEAAQNYLTKVLARDSLAADELYTTAVIADRLYQPRKAFFLFRKALQKFQSQNDAFMQGYCLWGMGDARYGLLDAGGALQPYHEMREVFTKRLEEAPGDTAVSRFLAVAYNKLGDAYDQLGQGEEAEKNYATALALRDTLRAHDPGNQDLLRELAISCERMGNVMRKRNSRAEAQQFYARALDIRQQIFERAGADKLAAHELSVSYNKLGDLWLEIGDRAQATTFYRHALALRERLAASDSSDWGAWTFLASSCERVGLALARQPDSASVYFQRAVEIRQRLVASDTARIDFLKNLAETNFLAATVVKSARPLPAEAILYSEGAVASFESLLKIRPGDYSYTTKLAQAYLLLGDLYFDLSDLEQAQESYHHALFIFADSPLADSVSLNLIRGVAEGYAKLSEFYGSEERVKFLQQAFRTGKLAQAKAETQESDDRRLAGIAHKLAEAWLKMERPDSAVFYWREAVTGRERLLAQQSDDMELVRQQVDDLFALGMQLWQNESSRLAGREYLGQARLWLRSFQEVETFRSARYEHMLKTIQEALEEP